MLGQATSILTSSVSACNSLDRIQHAGYGTGLSTIQCTSNQQLTRKHTVIMPANTTQSHPHMHARKHTHTHTHTHKHPQAHTRARARTHKHTRTHTHVIMSARTAQSKHTHTYTHAHTHTHTHTNTQTRKQKLSLLHLDGASSYAGVEPVLVTLLHLQLTQYTAKCWSRLHELHVGHSVAQVSCTSRVL